MKAKVTLAMRRYDAVRALSLMFARQPIARNEARRRLLAEVTRRYGRVFCRYVAPTLVSAKEAAGA